MERRNFLQLSALASMFSMSPLGLSNQLFQKKFIWINLRGGMDGINVLVPHADKDYARLRPTIALKKSDLLPINADFGLHPSLPNVHKLFQNKQAVLCPATASSYRKRSHFDAQKVLENGTANINHRDGWLNRLMSSDSKQKAIGIGKKLPLVLSGQHPADVWFPSNGRNTSDSVNDLLELVYSNNRELLELNDRAIALHPDKESMGRKARGNSFPKLAGQGAHLMKRSANIVSIDVFGWDTHGGQGNVKGRLANNLKQLDDGIAALQRSLGSEWRNTVVFVTSEFGRTAKENGSRGTDHGTAGLSMLLGGAVNGGHVLGDWPGLSASSLYEGRDLRPTSNIHAHLKGILQDHLTLSRAQLNAIFPDSGGIQAVSDLIV